MELSIQERAIVNGYERSDAELWEAVGGRKEAAKKDCTEIRLAEKSEHATREKVRER